MAYNNGNNLIQQQTNGQMYASPQEAPPPQYEGAAFGNEGSQSGGYQSGYGQEGVARPSNTYQQPAGYQNVYGQQETGATQPEKQSRMKQGMAFGKKNLPMAKRLYGMVRSSGYV